MGVSIGCRDAAVPHDRRRARRLRRLAQCACFLTWQATRLDTTTQDVSPRSPPLPPLPPRRAASPQHGRPRARRSSSAAVAWRERPFESQSARLRASIRYSADGDAACIVRMRTVRSSAHHRPAPAGGDDRALGTRARLHTFSCMHSSCSWLSTSACRLRSCALAAAARRCTTDARAPPDFGK